MAGLFDIGSSGIAAYRKALNVTGQNIANLNTDGYRRRDVSLTEISGSQGGITSISDQAGLGVRAEAINRAFDSFVAGRARDTQSDYFEAEALNTSLLALQDVVIPSDYDLGYFLNEFFSALGAVSQAPGDMAPRLAALEQANSLASSFSETANTLESLRNAILGQAQAVTSELNSNIKALQTMQSQLLSSGQGGSAPNEMLDERERLVLSIGDLAGISVEYGDRGEVTVTLGDTLGGPKLIEGLRSGQVFVDAASDRINVLAVSPLARTPTNQLSSGRLSGLIAAYESVSISIANLDALAQQVVHDLNTVHANGLTIDGQRGQDIYSLSNASATELSNNLGEISTTLNFSELTAPIDLRLIFNGKSNQWQGYDASGTLQVSGDKNINIAGLSLSIEGTPVDGDQLLLKSTQGSAANMRFLLTKPEDFAAAGLSIVSSSAKNLGNAEVQATVMAASPSTGIRPINQLLADGASTLAATRFLNDGIVASIPENVSAVELFSLSTQSTVSFTVSDDQLGGATNLTIQLLGSEEVFSLSKYTTLLNGDLSAILEADIGADLTADMGDIANLLNSGAITSSGDNAGFTLKDFGLYASGADGNLTISSSGSTSEYELDDTYDSVFGSSAGNATAIFKSGNNEASGIQIFTREGRQIAGSPLSQTDVIKYITPENGFFDGAEYRADYINGVSGIGYLGLGVERSSAQGDFSLTLNGAGFDAVVLGADDDDGDLALPNNTVQSSLIIQMGDDSTETIDIPEGVQAGYIAKLINAQTSDIGITATAYSKVALTDIPDGEVSFELSGDGITYQSVTAVVESGALTGLRDAINRHKLVTGVTASLSNDGDRLILVQKNGNDIVLGSIRSGGGEFNAELIDEQSIALSDTTVALGDSQLAARFIGRVALKSSVEFIVSGLNETESTSEQDVFLNGFISRNVDTTGSVQNLKFGIYDGIDTNESNPDGTSSSSAAGEYSLQIGGDTGLSASVSSSELSDVSSASLAAKLAEKIRTNAPIAVFAGQAVDTLPDEGSSLTVSLGGQAYTIEVTSKYVTYDTDGSVATQAVDLSVTGPEAGRLIAKFNKDNELQITTRDGIETGQNIVLTSETADATAFGLGETIVSTMTGRVFDPDAIEGDGVDFSNDVLINISGTEYSVTVAGTYSSGWSYSVSLPDDIPSGIAISIYDPVDGDGPRLVIEQTHTVTDTSGQNSDLRIEHSTSATQMGLAVVGSQILISDDGMVLTSVDGEAVQSSCTASSIAGERISLTNLPGEELIVIMTGGSGARRLTANYDVLASPPDLPPRALELKIIDESSGRVEVFDTISGQSIATRFLGDGLQFSAAGYQFVMNGSGQTNDLFHVGASGASAGDGRNLEAMMQLQSRNEQSGMGGFSDIFRSMITKLGAKVHASEIAKASASSLRDSAAEIDAEFSGVDLDTEAARLLEQQQAYQALARVLTTARELLNTLLDSI